MRTGLGVALALLVGLLLFQYAGRVLGDDPVTVHGDDRERPLAAAIAAFRPEEIVQVIAPNQIPAIHDPKLVAADAVEDLDDDDKVIGVVIEGEARAYPVKVLSAHEIANDEIRGRPIAVTW